MTEVTAPANLSADVIALAPNTTQRIGRGIPQRFFKLRPEVQQVIVEKDAVRTSAEANALGQAIRSSGNAQDLQFKSSFLLDGAILNTLLSFTSGHLTRLSLDIGKNGREIKILPAGLKHLSLILTKIAEAEDCKGIIRRCPASLESLVIIFERPALSPAAWAPIQCAPNELELDILEASSEVHLSQWVSLFGKNLTSLRVSQSCYKASGNITGSGLTVWPTTLRTLSIDIRTLSDEGLADITRHLPEGLLELSLPNGSYGDADITRDVIEKLPRDLQKLTLHWYEGLTESDFANLPGGLTFLNLIGHGRRKHAPPGGLALEGYDRLSELTLTDWRPGDSQTADQLASGICPTLKTFRLVGFAGLNDTDLSRVFQRLEKSLEALTLVGARDAELNGTCLKSLPPGLISLRFSMPGMSDELLAVLTSNLPEKLRDLDLQSTLGHKFTGSGFTKLPPQLGRLNLGFNSQLTDQGTKQLCIVMGDQISEILFHDCDSLTGMGFHSFPAKLVHLSFEACSRITDQGLGNILTHVPPSLHHLNLERCSGFTGRGFITLPLGLHELKLDHCTGFTLNGLKALAAKLPDRADAVSVYRSTVIHIDHQGMPNEIVEVQPGRIIDDSYGDRAAHLDRKARQAQASERQPLLPKKENSDCCVIF